MSGVTVTKQTTISTQHGQHFNKPQQQQHPNSHQPQQEQQQQQKTSPLRDVRKPPSSQHQQPDFLQQQKDILRRQMESKEEERAKLEQQKKQQEVCREKEFFSPNLNNICFRRSYFKNAGRNKSDNSRSGSRKRRGACRSNKSSSRKGS